MSELNSLEWKRILQNSCIFEMKLTKTAAYSKWNENTTASTKWNQLHIQDDFFKTAAYTRWSLYNSCISDMSTPKQLHIRSHLWHIVRPWIKIGQYVRAIVRSDLLSEVSDFLRKIYMESLHRCPTPLLKYTRNSTSYIDNSEWTLSNMYKVHFYHGCFILALFLNLTYHLLNSKSMYACFVHSH